MDSPRLKGGRFRAHPQMDRRAADAGAAARFSSRLRMGSGPVSYTHLDVYKRQDMSTSAGQKQSPFEY